MQEKYRQAEQNAREEERQRFEQLQYEMEQKMQEELRIKVENEVNSRLPDIQELQRFQKENEMLKNQIAQMQGSFQDLKTSLFQNEQVRKVQQQQIIHLKGNMRVFCRVKPIEYSKKSVVSFPQLIESGREVQHQTLQINLPKQGLKVYNYDQVFLPETSQKDIFKEIKPFV